MTSLPNYEIIKVIGSGCFGYVFEAYDKTNKKKVALKRIEKVGTQLSREYEILFKIKDCENVVKILDFFYSKTEDGKLIQNIVFEYVDTNLEHLLVQFNKNEITISEDNIKKFMYQIFNGLEWLHSKKVCHRDLKPENILVSNKGLIKICDFGSSKILSEDGKNTPYIVSRYYRAPELILCITDYTTAIDIWAAGCIIAELFLMKPFLKGKTEGDQIFAAFKVLGSMTKYQKQQYTERVPFDKQLLNEMGEYERTDLRKHFSMVKDYDNFIDLLLGMMKYLPEQRLTAKQAKEHPFFDSVRHLEIQ